MEDLIKLFIRSAFVDNMVFTFFFGMCSYLAVSKTVKTAVGLGLAVIFVLVVTVPINYLLETYVLADGALAWMGPEYADIDLSFLSFIMFIAVIASIVQLVEMLVEKFSPSLYGALGIFLPLIAVNCAILGGSLFMQQKNFPNIGIVNETNEAYGLFWNGVRKKEIKKHIFFEKAFNLKKKAKKTIFLGHSHQLAHYYRHLFQTVKFVINQTAFTYEEKRKYGHSTPSNETMDKN